MKASLVWNTVQNKYVIAFHDRVECEMDAVPLSSPVRSLSEKVWLIPGLYDPDEGHDSVSAV